MLPEPEFNHGTTLASASPTAAVWSRRVPGSDSALCISALLGLPGDQAEDIVSVTVAGSDSAWDFLVQLDLSLSSMKVSSEHVAQHCVNSVRGSVLWSETITARASALGNEDIFVCSVPSRSFDTPANRWLAASAFSLSRAESALLRLSPDVVEAMNTNREHIERVADLASQRRSDKRLAGVRAELPSVRERWRLQRNRRSSQLAPLFKLEEFSLDPFARPSKLLDALTDSATSQHHTELLRLVMEEEAETGQIQELRYTGAGLEIGKWRFLHPNLNTGSSQQIIQRIR
ncbi:MAG: hypothetical protein F2942_02225 [Actinobacteria bacterium]|uniref:Unannotated protein n=1 Tax=freshwater metagenome TaxID=449393 RepID=A0A6J7UE50_9ZZZZ|nr:hypothetical protein [Actinomycetota bacterium]